MLRMAMAASWSGRTVDRRRAVLLAVAAGVVTAVACGCVSALFMSERIDTRARDRAFTPVEPGAPVALERASLFDETDDGEQIYVYWWRVNDASVRIPGVEGTPREGAWFVSPALSEEMRNEPALEDRYPGALPLEPKGVSHRDELLAYRFVGPEVSLPEQLSLQRGLDWIGDGSEVLDPFPILVAALALIALPGLGLLTAAMAQFAPELERRLAVLAALGASRLSRLGFVAVHTVVCAAPGALIAALGWFLISPLLTAVPLVGKRVFPSDLGLPFLIAAVIGIGVVGLTIVVAAIRPGNRQGSRPVEYLPKTTSALRLLLLLTGLATMFVGTIAPGRTGAKLLFSGVIASAVGAVVALPFMIDKVGDALSRRRETLSLLVGRRLRRNAVSSARSLLAVGVLAALIPVVAAWIAVARDLDLPPDSPAYAVALNGVISSGQRDTLAKEIGAVPIEVTYLPHQNAPETFQLVGNCELLSGPFAPSRCGEERFSFDGGSGAALGPYRMLPGYKTRPPGARRHSTLFVSTRAEVVEDELRAFVVNGDRPGLQVTTPGREVFHESPLVDWILGGTALAGIVGGLALMLHLVGQSARLAVSRSRLLALGADVSVVRWLARGEAAAAVMLVGLGGCLVGVISSWMFLQVNASAGLPYGAIGLVLVSTLGAAAFAAVAAGASIPEVPRPIGEFSH